MMAMGEWWLRSEKDPRFNSHGTGMVGMFGCPPDATERIRELERELGCKAPDDLEVEYIKYRGERMRFIEIDGKRYDVPCCGECLFYDGGDGDYYTESCTHPDGDGVCARWGGSCENGHWNRYGPKCPLREVPEWAHLRSRITEAEALGCLIAFCMPMLLEDIAKLDLETQERIAKNLEELRRIARMKPEERPLCTMDQEESIERGIEACTVKGEKE